MKDRALKAWKDKRTKERSHMKALGYEPNTEDEDEGESDGGHLMFALGVTADVHQPVDDANFSDHLVDDDADEIPNLSSSDSDPEADPELNPHPVALLNEVAYRRYRKKIAARKMMSTCKAPRAPKKKDGVHIKSIADFDRPAARGLINALPRDRKSLTRLAKLCPTKNKPLGPMSDGLWQTLAHLSMHLMLLKSSPGMSTWLRHFRRGRRERELRPLLVIELRSREPYPWQGTSMVTSTSCLSMI